MQDDKGFLSFSLRILGNEIIAFRIEVDDFRTKWALIAVAIGGLLIAATPHIQEITQWLE